MTDSIFYTRIYREIELTKSRVSNNFVIGKTLEFYHLGDEKWNVSIDIGREGKTHMSLHSYWISLSKNSSDRLLDLLLET